MTLKTSNELNSEKDSSSGVPVLKSYNGYDFDDFETKVIAIQVINFQVRRFKIIKILA